MQVDGPEFQLTNVFLSLPIYLDAGDPVRVPGPAAHHHSHGLCPCPLHCRGAPDRQAPRACRTQG